MGSRIVAVAFCSVGLWVGCDGGRNNPAPDGGPGGDASDGGPTTDSPGGGCGVGQIPCGSECVDATATTSCGRCGHTCDANEQCDRGSCVSSCAGWHPVIAQPQSPIGLEPRYIAAGDFNNDGKVDAVAVSGSSFGSDDATIVLGDGKGGFAHARSYPTVDNPDGLFAGDVDGDGKLDVVVSGEGNLYFLQGHGDGEFTRIVISGQPDFTIGRDLNEDGKLDIVGQFNEVVVRLGGASGFGAQTIAVPNVYPQAFAIGELTGDTHLDLATFSSGTFNVYAGTGTGTFSLSTSTAIPTSYNRMIAGDFVGDDREDWILCSGTQCTLYQNAAGVPASPIGLTLPYATVRTFDLDSNGKDDLIFANDALCTMRANASSFDAPICYQTPSGGAVAVAVANGEALVIEGGAAAITVVPRAGNAFVAPPVVYTSGYTLHSTLADFNGDSRPEVIVPVPYDDRVVVAGYVAGTGLVERRSFAMSNQPQDAMLVGGTLLVAMFSKVATIANATSVTPGAETTIISGAYYDRAIWADVDHDGDQDVVTLEGDQKRVGVYLATGTTIPGTATSTVDTTSSMEIEVADMNNDLRPDLVVYSNSMIGVRLAAANGSFGAFTNQVAASSTQRILLVDLNADGMKDVVTDRGYALNTAGTLGAITGLYQQGAAAIGAADLDGDGTTDLLYGYGDALVLWHQAAGAFAATRSWRIGGGTRGYFLADIDGEGHADLFGPNGGGVRFVSGATGFALPELSVAPYGYSLARGDFDEDGRDDLVLTGQDNHVLVMMAGGTTGAATFHQTMDLGSSLRPNVVDVNADGHLDIARDGIVHFGDGHGNFAIASNPPSQLSRTNAVGFIDRDAFPDMLVQSQVVGSTRVWFGDPTTGFRQGPEVERSVGACATDLDADGLGDMVTTTLGLTVTAAKGNGDGTFGTPSAVPGITAGNFGAIMTCPNLDTDRDPDLVLTQATLAPSTITQTVVMYDHLTHARSMGNATSVDGALQRFLIGSSSQFTTVEALDDSLSTGDHLAGPAVGGDFDGDGVLDVATATPGGIYVTYGSCN